MLRLVSLVVLAISGALAVELGELVGPYAQCGGIGYGGDTSCYPDYTCVKLNDWFSQCQPTSSLPTTTATGPGGTPTTTTTQTSTSTTQGQTPTPTPTTPRPTASPGGLQDKFSKRGKQYFGTAADPGTLGNNANAQVILREFGVVTAENSLKWRSTEPNRGQFNFSDSDRLVDWATTNGKLVRGNNLVWHSQLPTWVTGISDRAVLTEVLVTHVQTVARRYAGRIYHWDVVNEVLNEDGTLRRSIFNTVLGESFITLAFQEARKADPRALLYINDYNLDSANPKVAGMVALVNRINEATPGTIDGIGTQKHLQTGQGSTAQEALTALAAANVKEIAITELDIAGASTSDYTAVVRACLNTPKCVGITVWGVRDPDSWRASTNPLLFDAQFQPKQAYTAVSNLLN